MNPCLNSLKIMCVLCSFVRIITDNHTLGIFLKVANYALTLSFSIVFYLFLDVVHCSVCDSFLSFSFLDRVNVIKKPDYTPSEQVSNS